ncbi:hypothetical protein MKX01_030070 [Papaver californicum]|nr:hypothetical protein MKX01_030070 [Papaver californicum]
MSKLTTPFSLLVIFIILCNYFPQIQSEKEEISFIRLPSEQQEVGVCTTKPSVPHSCPVNCFRTDPVCGVDGVTYWCGCADAYCAGTKVAKYGFCEVGSNNNGSPVSGQALLLVHIVWLFLLGFSLLFGLF